LAARPSRAPRLKRSAAPASPARSSSRAFPTRSTPATTSPSPPCTAGAVSRSRPPAPRPNGCSRASASRARSAHADALPYFDLKRIELARALACAPDLLLLDEWLAGLNPTELEAGIELVRSLNADGMTIVMVEHVMHAIRSLCGHIVVLDAGRVIASGTPEVALADAGVMRVYLGESA
jgi:hypothetical protein